MGFCNLLNDYKPHFFLILSNLCLSIFIVLLKSVIEGGVSGPVFVVYEHILASILLFTLAFFFERATRPPLTFRVFCWAFLLGFLQITLTQLLLTSSIRYIAPSTQSILLNTVPVIVFVLAVSFRQEIFRFRSVDGQAKIWGILISTFGATLMIVWTGPEIRRLEQIGRAMSTGNRVIGFLMMAGAVLAAASSNLFVAHVTKKYDMELTLAAMMCFSGTLQTAIVAAIAEKSASAWEIKFKGPEILAILYGGILVTGLSYYISTWCIYKKGAVFSSAFSPLLIVFSFLLETFVLGKVVCLGRIVGAVQVVTGLYLLLWAKAHDSEEKNLIQPGVNSPLLSAEDC